MGPLCFQDILAVVVLLSYYLFVDSCPRLLLSSQISEDDLELLVGLSPSLLRMEPGLAARQPSILDPQAFWKISVKLFFNFHLFYYVCVSAGGHVP